MSIATDITGSAIGGSANQLLELLANPNLYADKLKAMEDATAEYKKYVEAFGVAAEIGKLRDQAAAAKQEADDYRDKTIAEADATLKSAKDDAAATRASARAAAAKLNDQSAATKQQAEALMAAATKKMQEAEAALAKASAAQADADTQAAAAAEAQVRAAKETADALSLKDDIIAKHKEFIEGL